MRPAPESSPVSLDHQIRFHEEQLRKLQEMQQREDLRANSVPVKTCESFESRNVNSGQKHDANSSFASEYPEI